MMSEEQQLIDQAFEEGASLNPQSAVPELRAVVERVLQQLTLGQLRVAEPTAAGWQVHSWLKKAILLSFRLQASTLYPHGLSLCLDKIPLRHSLDQPQALAEWDGRLVPGAIVRHGAYLAPKVVVMPAFVNVGAYIDCGTMVDTWATVGSCAQIGKHVHLSGGVGIGGVLEPLQANPTIIEDHVFIGARSEIVEGVVVEHHAVIGMGVYIGQSTKIYDRSTGEIFYGRVPAGSVVVAGSLPSDDGRYALNAAIIVKRVDEKTRAKTSINDLLRG